MKPPYPSLTSEWHNDTYPTIDPKRPELSLYGKKIVISGGGAGLGKGMTEAFADAGASSIAILGRREGLLQQTKREIEASHPKVTVSTYVADVTDEQAMRKAAKEIGSWDCLISNAGYLATPEKLTDANAVDWWRGFEINVKGSFNIVRGFHPTRSKDATVVAVNAASVHLPGAFNQGQTSYTASKIAALKIFEILAVECPDVHFVSMHPGVVETDMKKKSKMSPPGIDTMELPSHFTVWLCSEEARFLRGRFVWANWDVSQLKEKREEIDGGMLLTSNVLGWPFDGK